MIQWENWKIFVRPLLYQRPQYFYTHRKISRASQDDVSLNFWKPTEHIIRTWKEKMRKSDDNMQKISTHLCRCNDVHLNPLTSHNAYSKVALHLLTICYLGEAVFIFLCLHSNVWIFWFDLIFLRILSSICCGLFEISMLTFSLRV